MDFTEIYRQTSDLVLPSPAGPWVLTAVEDRLVVRRSETFQIVRTWLVDTTPSASAQVLSSTSKQRFGGTVNDAWITHIGWSFDAEYIFACCARRGTVNVFSLRDERWNARIEGGVEGIAKVEWAPDGRSILCFSEWGLRVTIWSLVSGSATYIQFPKYPGRGYAFRRDGRYFVLAERHKSRDTIGVYDASSSYNLVRHFPAPTSSLSSLALSPKGDHIAISEGPLEYKLSIMNLAGQQVGSFSPERDPGLGIRCMSWHPSGNMLAIGGYDDKIHVINSLSWTPIITFELRSRVQDGVVVWKEPVGWIESTQGRGFLSYDRVGVPSVPISRAENGGIVQLEWNITGTLLLVRWENCGQVVHLYSFPSGSDEFRPRLCSVLVQTNPVISAEWNPRRGGSLALCCGNGALYTWSDEWVGEESSDPEEMAECIGVPAKKFTTREVRWFPDGKGLVLFDKESFCCSFEAEDADGVMGEGQ